MRPGITHFPAGYAAKAWAANLVVLVAEDLVLSQPTPTALKSSRDGQYCVPAAGLTLVLSSQLADAYSRLVVGWHVDVHRLSKLVLMALKQTLMLRQSLPGLIVHAN